MAYTKIHAIKASVSTAVNYIINPDKTDGKILVDSFACAPESAAIDFKQNLSRGRSSNGNKAFHLIQSFLPGEVSYGEAHQIGIELADRLLEGKYSYVVSTHIDKNHVHNHIVFCATDNIDHKKYDDNKRSYHHIRQLSDTLCSEHNLSIITPGAGRGKKYNEWAAGKDGITLKAQLKKDIDAGIAAAKDYEDFLSYMKNLGYEIKGETFGEESAKYIAFRKKDTPHFIRGSERSLGKNYSKADIHNRIINKSKHRIPFPKKDPLNAKPKDLLNPKKPSSLIDTSEEKYAASPGLRRWANVQNLKMMAENYAAAGTMGELEAAILQKRETVNQARKDLVAMEKSLKPKAEILHYARMYHDNLRYEKAYLKSKDPDRYYRDHADNLNLFHAAEHALKDVYHINIRTMDLPFMEESYRKDAEKKESLSSCYKSEKKTLADMEKKLSDMQKYFGSSKSDLAQAKENELLSTQNMDDKKNQTL